MLDRFVVPGVRRAVQPWRWLPFALRLRIARLRSLIGRKRLLRRGAMVGLLAIVVGVGVSNRAALGDEQAGWGTLVEVAIVAEGREVGEVVTGQHIRFESLPAVAVPDDSIQAEAFDDSHAAAQLHVGDVLRRRDLVEERQDAVGEDQRAIAIPVGADVPALTVGRRVDVFVFDDAFGPVASAAAEPVSGTVMQLLEDAVVVSVDQQHAATVAAGIVNGRVLLASA